MTFKEVFFRHTTTITSSAKPADFALLGTQLLMERCGSIGDELFYVITGPRNQGPNVVMDSKFLGNGHIQAHQRWATGFLVDKTQVPQGGIDLMNRGEMGSGSIFELLPNRERGLPTWPAEKKRETNRTKGTKKVGML